MQGRRSRTPSRKDEAGESSQVRVRLVYPTLQRDHVRVAHPLRAPQFPWIKRRGTWRAERRSHVEQPRLNRFESRGEFLVRLERVFLADLLREILYNPNRALALLVCFPTVQFLTKSTHEKRSHDENPDVAFFARKFSKKKAIKELL